MANAKKYDRVKFYLEKMRRNFFFLVIQELVAGQYESELYTVHGLMLESRKRREHLSSDDLQKNKAILESFTKGGNFQNFDQNGAVSRLIKNGIVISRFVRNITKKLFSMYVKMGNQKKNN